MERGFMLASQLLEENYVRTRIVCKSHENFNTRKHQAGCLDLIPRIPSKHSP
jgi:hypothetical protein